MKALISFKVVLLNSRLSFFQKGPTSAVKKLCLGPDEQCYKLIPASSLSVTLAKTQAKILALAQGGTHTICLLKTWFPFAELKVHCGKGKGRVQVIERSQVNMAGGWWVFYSNAWWGLEIGGYLGQTVKLYLAIKCWSFLKSLISLMTMPQL